MAINVLVAPSGYKGCLDAESVAKSIAIGLKRASSEVEVEELALADGGEGTAATLARTTGGTIHSVR